MATTQVDAVWWSLTQIADRDGVSKQAVSKSVLRLVESGLEVERDTQGRIARVNVVDYDRKRGRYADPSKAQAMARASQEESRDLDSYDEALRQKTWHEAERKRLELSELKGELIRVAELKAAIEVTLEAIVTVIDRLPNATDDLAAAVAREGGHGLRVALRQRAKLLREEIAAALAQIAGETGASERAMEGEGAET